MDEKGFFKLKRVEHVKFSALWRTFILSHLFRNDISQWANEMAKQHYDKSIINKIVKEHRKY